MLKLHYNCVYLDHCLNGGEPKFNTWAHHNCLNVMSFINLIFFFLERKVCYVYMQFEPKLAKPRVHQVHQTQAYQAQWGFKPNSIKIKSSSSRFRPTKVQFSEFQLKHPQRTKKKQAIQLCLISQVVKPYLGYQDHCFILKFVVYYMFLMRIFCSTNQFVPKRDLTSFN